MSLQYRVVKALHKRPVFNWQILLPPFELPLLPRAIGPKHGEPVPITSYRPWYRWAKTLVRVGRTANHVPIYEYFSNAFTAQSGLGEHRGWASAESEAEIGPSMKFGGLELELRDMLISDVAERTRQSVAPKGDEPEVKEHTDGLTE